MSFLPYWTLGLLLFVLGLSIFLFYTKKKQKIRYFLFAIIVIFGGVSGWGLFKIGRFYDFTTPLYQPTSTGGIHLLYGNIYKNNEDYTGIINLIEQEHPDIILFVEFADHHYRALKSYLQKTYPYTNTTSGSQKIVGSTVFSKYPLDNWADDFPQGAWRYGYFSFTHSGETYYFYLVHTSSPIDQKHFEMRNTQIQTFFTDFMFHKRKQRNDEDKVIVLGDFNTSPWSPQYWNFAEGFKAGSFVNITRIFPILFTWKRLGLPFLQVHIDHIFINRHLVVNELRKVRIPGSDHDGFVMGVK